MNENDIELLWATLPAEHETMAEFYLDAFELAEALAASDPNTESERVREIRAAYNARCAEWVQRPGSPLGLLWPITEAMDNCAVVNPVMHERYSSALTNASLLTDDLLALMIEADKVTGAEDIRAAAEHALGLRWV
ncbi:hypothetical protein [uncultured Tessaracoccus sp.]|uniref:hypothetical protein n=1 Tax=uncultured Tessaracoccus sp. TaxID=905023 RepID=UPI0026025E47|nr:hypothetical protein [uncultured Tessaracoccus sp.]